MKTLWVLLLSLLFIGCSDKHYAPLPTVQQVDLDRYLGTWYEIARYEHSFEKGCTDVSATYSLREDRKIKVENRCTKNGKPDVAIGKAYATDETNSKLKVSFFGPFYGNYWIVMLDDAYSYAVIGEPSREYLWILARKPQLDQTTLNGILEKLPTLGYDTSKLIWTEQGERHVSQ